MRVHPDPASWFFAGFVWIQVFKPELWKINIVKIQIFHNFYKSFLGAVLTLASDYELKI